MTTTETLSRSDARRLLVVDDSRAMQAIIRRMLESSRLGATEVRTVASGEEALKMLPAFKPHLVISDWHMPGMTGIEMLQLLRQTGARDVPVGFVTTETQALVLAQAHTNGAAFILHKPFHDDDLIRAVGQVLGRIPAGAPAPEPAASKSEAQAQASAEGQAEGRSQAHSLMQALVQSHLPAIPLRVIGGESFEASHLSDSNLLVLYAGRDIDRVGAIVAANHAAVCMLGSGGDLAPQAVRHAIQDGRPLPAMTPRAIEFFRSAAAALPQHFPDLPEQQFKDANFVPKDFPKLRATLAHARLRPAYRLSVPGFGDGRFVFIRT